MDEHEFWARTTRNGDCWEWTGNISSSGYGSVYYDGYPQQAHRVAYKLVKGTIPRGLELDHLCGNRRCVNPDHLEAVTHYENWLRGKHPIAIKRRGKELVQKIISKYVNSNSGQRKVQ